MEHGKQRAVNEWPPRREVHDEVEKIVSINFLYNVFSIRAFLTLGGVAASQKPVSFIEKPQKLSPFPTLLTGAGWS